MIIGIAISLPAAGKDSFKEPRSDAEWKAFCEAPDCKQWLLAIDDKAQRERVAGTLAEIRAKQTESLVSECPRR